jgi:hypothetical protein
MMLMGVNPDGTQDRTPISDPVENWVHRFKRVPTGDGFMDAFFKHVDVSEEDFPLANNPHPEEGSYSIITWKEVNQSSEKETSG